MRLTRVELVFIALGGALGAIVAFVFKAGWVAASATFHIRTLRLEDVARLCRGIDKVRPWITALDWSPGGLTDAADLRARLVKEPEPVQLTLF